MQVRPTLEKLEITPAVIIGIGRVGEMVLRELAPRRKLFLEFQGLDLKWFDNLLAQYLIEESVSSQETLNEVRERFFEAVNLKQVGFDLQNKFRHVSGHTYQPFVNLVQPRVFVIGATWEPAGAALLWPIADLVRRALGTETNYELIGIFLSANYESSPDVQSLGNALTFACLIEGEALLKQSSLSWQESILKLFRFRQVPKRRYDQIFLLDSLKANNATVLAPDNEGELVTNTAALLEGLTYTQSTQLIDTALLDDFDKTAAQIYIGAGTSSLRVPLKEISKLVLDYTIGILLKEHLLHDLTTDQEDFAVAQAQQLGSTGLRKLAQEIEKLLGQCFRDLSQKGIRDPQKGDRYGTLAGPVKYQIKPGHKGAMTSGIASVKIKAPNPFSGELSLHINAVRGRLRDEIQSRHFVVKDVENCLQRIEFESPLAIYDSATITLLQAGDIGLYQAVAMLKQAAKNVGNQASAFKQEAELLEEEQIPHWRNIVEGQDRWYYDMKRLRPIVQSKPRFWAIFVRVAMLVALIFQFYWSSVVSGIQPWPFYNFSIPLLSEAWGASWDWYLFILTWIPALLLLFIFVVIPELALNTVLRFHRTSLRNLLKLELNHIIFETYGDKLEELSQELSRRATFLSKIWEGLQTFTSEALTDIDRTLISNDDYLEYIPVSPREIADFQIREKIADLTLKQQNFKRVVDSWLPNNAKSIWDAKTSKTVLEDLEGKVKPVVHEILVRPVESYLKPDEYTEWIYRLWLSSVPWLKRLNGDERDEEPVNVNILSLYNMGQSEFAQVVQQEADHCQIFPWFDPYRILLTRLDCGVQAKHLARFEQLRQAFELQTPSQRSTMIQDEAIFAEYPALLPEEEPVSTEDTDNNLVKEQPVDDSDKVDPLSIPDPQVAWKQNLEDISAEFIKAASNPDITQNDKEGILAAIRSVQDYLHKASTNLDKQEMAESLWSLDSCRDAMDKQEISPHLSVAFSRLDEFLRQHGIQPITPPIGEEYDPHKHGRAADLESSAEVPSGHILKLDWRGYQDSDTGNFLVEPQVVLSSGSSVAVDDTGEVE